MSSTTQIQSINMFMHQFTLIAILFVVIIKFHLTGAASLVHCLLVEVRTRFHVSGEVMVVLQLTHRQVNRLILEVMLLGQ